MTVIVLHDGAGVSVKELATDMGVPEGTIKSWLSRGRSAAAERLRRADESLKEDHVR